MKKGAVIFTAILLSILTSCEKRSIEPSKEEEPTLFLSGTLDGQAFHWSSGIAPHQASPANALVDQLLVYTSTIADTSQNSTEAFGIAFNNHQIPFSNPSSDIQETIKVGFIDYQTFPPQPENPQQLSTVLISYTKNGVVYDVPLLPQTGHHFEITEVKSVTRGKTRFWETKFNFSCLLYDFIQDDTITLENGEGVMSFLME